MIYKPVTHRRPRRFGPYALAFVSLMLVMWFYGEPQPWPFALVLMWPVGAVLGRMP